MIEALLDKGAAKMKRNIIEIDEEKCNGCGICVDACHEGAIELVNGKARLVSDTYCDGLGACLPQCPTGAIRMTEKEAAAYDEAAVQQRSAIGSLFPQVHVHEQGHQCPGSAARQMERKPVQQVKVPLAANEVASELTTWPVQIKLVNPRAPYFDQADILVAADCTAFAYAGFHQEFIRGRVTLIGCPKLDDNEFYTEKFTDILANNDIHSIHVVRMEVPCCGGIVSAVKQAMLASGKIVPYNEIVIGIDGTIR
jgi:ferredoxin